METIWPLHGRVARLRRKEVASLHYRARLASVLAALGLENVTVCWFELPPECLEVVKHYAAAQRQWSAIIAGPWQAKAIQAQTSRPELEAALEGMHDLLDEAPWESWVETNGRLLSKALGRRWGDGSPLAAATPAELRARLPEIAWWLGCV